MGLFKTKHRDPDSEDALRAHVDHAAVVSGRLLIVTGWAYDVAGPLQRLELFVGKARLKLDQPRIFRGVRPDVAEHLKIQQGKWGFVFTARIPSPISAGKLVARLISRHATARVETAVQHDTSLLPLRRLINGYAGDDRARILEHCIRHLELTGIDATLSIATEVSHLRAFVRLTIEHASVIQGHGIFLSGWCIDPEGSLASVHVKHGEVIGPDLLACAARYPRPDVLNAFPQTRPGERPGLLAFIPMSTVSSNEPLDLLLKTTAGEVALSSHALAEPPRSRLGFTQVALATIDPNEPETLQLLHRHIGPMLDAYWLPAAPAQQACDEQIFGEPCSVPEISVIVPLYGRHDFILYQTALLAKDPDFDTCELIYVVDDPRIHQAALRLSSETFPIHRSPFRIVSSGINLGFAGANNFGVQHARGKRLVLLNSDVLPKRPGWLKRLSETYDSLPAVGALAPRLLFHDETVQHDGIDFALHPRFPGLWFNEHPGKGLPKSLALPPAVAEVPAVTAACLMVDKHLYLEVGGLDEGYILGDFEDTDLCLKLRAQGLNCYIDRSEELYHLERQSQSLFGDQSWRFKLTLYNSYRHTTRWHNVLNGSNGLGKSA